MFLALWAPPTSPSPVFSANTSLTKDVKQLKLFPFPNYEPDTDVEMEMVTDSEPIVITQYHTRLSSDASSCSFDSAGDSRMFTNKRVLTSVRHLLILYVHTCTAGYPTLNIYPQTFVDGASPYSLHSSSTSPTDSPPAVWTSTPKITVGLLQPSSGLTHHGWVEAVLCLFFFLFYSPL